MNTHETYVSLETAKLLKQAGFDWECDKIYYCYHEDNDTWDLESNNKNHLRILELDYCLLAPSLAVAQKWLREVKNIQIIASPLAGSKNWTYLITKDFWLLHEDISGIALTPENFDTYEEALETGIQTCLSDSRANN